MELLFYHLQTAPLERVLPQLLSKSLDKGWRVIVEASASERVDEIDAMLWSFSGKSFLPHAKADEAQPDTQPILLTTSTDNLNNAHIRFFIDAGDVTAHPLYERLVYIFNGLDEAAVSRARLQWSAASGAGITATYWLQDEAGAWKKKA